MSKLFSSFLVFCVFSLIGMQKCHGVMNVPLQGSIVESVSTPFDGNEDKNLKVSNGVSLGAKTYDGHKLYKVVPKSENEVNVIKNLNQDGIEFWDDTLFVNDDFRVMVAPSKQGIFEDVIRKADIEVKILIDDVQGAINRQQQKATTNESEGLLSMNWVHYHDLDSIYNWLDELAENYTGIVTTEIIGTSVEGRQIKGIVINYNRGRAATQFGMIEGTMHAREWISPAVVNWIIKEFLTSTDPEVREMAESFEWHIFPVVNPDGYVYTFTENRMWRKNRSKASSTNCTDDDDMSNGVDLNRNFPFEWMTVGATQDACSNTYAGPSPLSEPETLAISNYVNVLNGRGKIVYYFAFHSYTQLIIIPYSHLLNVNDPELPDDYANMYDIAQRGRDAMYERYNTSYRVGISADVMYPMSGTSFDWVKHHADVPVCYLIELRDLGTYGFLLAPDQIIPSGLETIDALVAMHKRAGELDLWSSAGVTVYHSLVMIVSGFIITKLL